MLKYSKHLLRLWPEFKITLPKCDSKKCAKKLAMLFIPMRSKKGRRFEKLLGFARSHSI